MANGSVFGNLALAIPFDVCYCGVCLVISLQSTFNAALHHLFSWHRFSRLGLFLFLANQLPAPTAWFSVNALPAVGFL